MQFAHIELPVYRSEYTANGKIIITWSIQNIGIEITDIKAEDLTDHEFDMIQVGMNVTKIRDVATQSSNDPIA